MMSFHWSLVSLCLILAIFQISTLHSTPLVNSQPTLHYLIKNLMTESNIDEQSNLLNQLREYLNRMCVMGYLGSSHAHECQRIVDLLHQNKYNNDDDDNGDNHGIQKRFFCNGFIGCKNAGR